MEDAFKLLLTPFLAALLLAGIHAYLGIHVLRRNIIFVDLALAQISALGATFAFMLGHLPQSDAAYAYSLLFTLAGAAMLSFSRNWTGKIPQEAIVGVIYVVSAAAAFLLIDKAPQGAEHIKQLLIGSILTVTHADLAKLAGLYGVIGLFHWAFRKRFLLLSFDPEQARSQSISLWRWDFLFYASFGIVVTSSVAIGGVLLVFSFLIIPAAVGLLYSSRIFTRLLVAWIASALASLSGLGASYIWDLPTGAAMVCAFGVTLGAAALLKPILLTHPLRRQALYRRSIKSVTTFVLALLMASSAWLIFRPHADQPLLEVLENASPSLQNFFLRKEEKQLLTESRHDANRYRTEALRLTNMEQDSRWQGVSLADDEVRKVSSYTQSFYEMQKGEEFVQHEITNRVRDRQRWLIGAPALAISFALLLPLLAKRRTGS